MHVYAGERGHRMVISMGLHIKLCASEQVPMECHKIPNFYCHHSDLHCWTCRLSFPTKKEASCKVSHQLTCK